ncbi:DUF2079 domain-containing protein [Kitasatospora sp. NBC_01300]|uniref:DUF2079 domain-containing protein n=1 Tax=Kitasatospora sp. NBC_01300 TaxID=2903574 RepID=UPI00352F8B35|nr:DUF2079 domain-containing protein [Kitasatospora sp. NBC_01300]
MDFRRVLPWSVAALLAPLYAAVSLTRYGRLESAGFDLGIFEEAVRAYARFEAPVVALKGTGFNLLGDHFSPVLAVLAPFYRLWPGAGTLLVAQAVLVALSAVPVTAYAVRVLGTAGGAVAGVAYGLSAGLQSAVAFDFHEVAFAVPLAAAAVVALARGRYGPAVAWALPLLLVKEDQALLVAAVGGYVWWRGRRRLGAATVLAAVAAGLLVTLVVIPALNPGGEYTYAHMGEFDGGNPLARLLFPAVKALTVLLLLAPTLLLALRSPLVLLAGVLLAARFWVDNPVFWRTGQHYDAVLVPLLFTAGLHGVGLLLPRLPRLSRLPRLGRGLPVAAGMLAVTVALTATGPVAGVLSGDARRGDGRAAQVRRVLAVVPDGARVAAANRLAPQLTGRCTVSLFPYLTPPGGAGGAGGAGGPGGWGRPVAEWVAVLEEPDVFPVPVAEQRRFLAGLVDGGGYRRVADGAGVAVYHWQPGQADGR